MLDDLVEIEESELPPLSDARMMQFALEMGQEYTHFEQSRLVLASEIWPSCDRGFMCIRDEMQYIPTMKYVDNSMLGESDLRDAAKALRNQVLQGTLSNGDAWLEAVSLSDDDDEGALEKIKQMLSDQHRKAGTRKAFTCFVDQLLVRGTSAIGRYWNRRRTVHRIPRGMATTLNVYAQTTGAMDEDGNELTPSQLSKVKYWKTVYNGPKSYPIDMHRLFLDPKAELEIDEDIATIYVLFKSLRDLKYAKDDQGEPLYDQKMLEGIREWTYSEWYQENKHACDSTMLLGIDPSLDHQDKFVPVYLFHKVVRETDDGEMYVDKFFYLARGANNSDWAIIRVQDNPSDFGDKPFYFTQLDRWLNTPYGTGVVEKSLSAWKKKNILSAIGTNAAVINVFPPYSYASGVIKDDRKPRWQPGAGQEIVIRPNIGMDWIKPYPINANGAMFGMQDERYQAEKIIGQTGVSAAGVTTDPSKSMSKSKTATEIRQQATDGVISQEEIVMKIIDDVLQPFCQASYNDARQYYDKDTKFVGRGQNGKPQQQKVTAEELNKDRQIEIVGRQGLASKASEIQNLNEALTILAQKDAAMVIPTLPVMLQDLIFKLLGRLGIEIKPEYKTPPEMLAARTPQAQQAALQGALQNPQMREQIVQMLINSPEGQQFIQQIKDMAAQEAVQQHTQHQTSVKAEASQQVAQQKQQQQAAMQQIKMQQAQQGGSPVGNQ